MSGLAGLPLLRRGKVRDLYGTAQGILMVASDRVSAYDVVLPTPIPDKGAVLTGLSAHWFKATLGIVANHLLTTDPDDFPPEAKPHRKALQGRAMLVRRAEMVPVECVARGFLSGSAWRDYRASGAVCEIRLRSGLVESSRLEEPIFTPATKAETGHDENISFEQACEMAGRAIMERLRELTLALYSFAAERAEAAGIIVADTKFEFGFCDGELLLADEALTPDSSRFWPAADWRPGGPQPSFDKQQIRDWLDGAGWDRTPPAPELPAEIVAAARARYIQAYELLSGKRFDDWIRGGDG